MVDSIPRWQLSLFEPIQSDHLLIADGMIPPLGRKHFHGKTQLRLGPAFQEWKAGPSLNGIMTVENLLFIYLFIGYHTY